jgi:hypothetical protein
MPARLDSITSLPFAQRLNLDFENGPIAIETVCHASTDRSQLIDDSLCRFDEHLTPYQFLTCVA